MVIEAGWLLAMVIVPLYFNVYSSRVFEPDKLALLRSIALGMGAAWVIKTLETVQWDRSAQEAGTSTQRGSLWRRMFATPFVLPTILLLGAYLLSTALSVAPGISFWGSYMRLQGTYTTFSYIVVFFLMLGTMRQREQVDRLFATIILTSLPISLYGILQHYNLDPLPWTGDVTMRVAGNMGNAIFVAAYLIMAIPITLTRLIESLSAVFKEPEGTVSHALLAGCYTFVLAVQLICTFFTQSRGPWLGLLGGIYFFLLIALISLRRSLPNQSSLDRQDVLRAIGFAIVSMPVGIIPAYVVLVAMKRGWRWAWLSWVTNTLLIVSFLVAFNLPNTPLSPFREMPYIGRLGRIFETEAGTGKVRVLIWEGALDLISADPLRALVGYGPETMHVAYNPYYPPDLAHYEARNASPDRSHNETLDALVITGGIGWAVYMFLFGSIIYYGLCWLGMLHGERQRNVFLALSLGGALLGAALPRVLGGTFVLSGVGLPMGFIVGASLYLMLAAAFFYGGQRPVIDMRRQLPLIGLLAAIVGHFIEIHFGIAIASTRLHFWGYAAVFALLGLNLIAQDSAEEAPASEVLSASARTERQNRQARRREDRRVVQRESTITPVATRDTVARRRLLIGCLLVSLILLTLGFDFVTNAVGETNALRIIQLSLTTRAARNDYSASYGVLWMFVLTWVVGALVVLGETERACSSRADNSWWASSLAVYSGVTLATFAIGMTAYAGILRPPTDVSRTVGFYYTLVLLLGFALAWALARYALLPSRGLWRAGNLWAYPILLVVVGIVIFATNMSIVRADVYYKQGLRLEEGQRWDSSIQLYNRAISLAPDQDYYYLFLGRALMGKASSVGSETERTQWFEASRQALERALALNPLNTDHYANLGRLYRSWADYTSDPGQLAQRLEMADGYYLQATQHSPNNAQMFDEWALVYLAKGEYDKALEKLNHSISLDSQFAYTYLVLGNLKSLEGKIDEASAAYEQALVHDPGNAEAHSALGYMYYQQGNITDAVSANQMALQIDPNLPRAHSTLGLIYFEQGRFEEAVQENLRVLELLPSDVVSHRNLALLFGEMGRIDEALRHAQEALALSSEADKAAMQSYIDQLQAQKAAAQS